MLRDDFCPDICDVFLELGEFARPVEVDGKRIKAVLDDSVQGERDFESGLASDGYRLFARSRDLPRKRPGSTLILNKVPYIVLSWREDEGMADVALVRAQ